MTHQQNGRMIACPTSDQLGMLLTEQLDDASRDEVARHVDQCAVCQQTLDELTENSVVIVDDLMEHNRDEPSTELEIEAMLTRLRSQPPGLNAKINESFQPGEVDPNAPLSISDFRLEDRIGKGGMGSVYRAVQTSLNKPVAIKMLDDPATADQQIVERFMKEACAAASLRHPNIVDVHGIGRTDDGGYFLVMDLIEGADLQQLASEGRSDDLDPAETVATIADAIHHAHAHGIIHRDVKPNNVLLSEAGELFITDFGIAKIAGPKASTLSAHGLPIGTPSYMAPEQADPRRGQIGPATDVYGLGGILYFLLTGRHPYTTDEGSQVVVLAQVLSNDLPERPRSLNPGVSSALEEICLKCLQKRSADRFATAGELAVALRSLGNQQTSTTTSALKIAVLHRRNAEPDTSLARTVENKLAAAGHEVFVDREVSVDLEWAQEIERQIYEADVVIPLLSASSIASEMLTYEVELAWRAQSERAGNPHILPVRVAFDDELPVELGRIVNSLPTCDWAGADDDERLVSSVLGGLVPPQVASTATSLTRIEPPMGAVPLDSDFYLVRDADALYQSAVSRRDSIILVRGARQMGKTSLMARGMKQARDAGIRVVLTDFQKLNASDLASAESLFLAIGDWLAEKLDLDASPHDTWNARRGASVNFERFLRREVLAKLDSPLVWGLDEIDRLFMCDFSSEVFGLFRSWHNERALDPSGPWSQLTLAIAYATEAHLFITDINQSPFNVGTRISLDDLSFSQVSELNRRYQSPLADDEAINRFVELVGGQPYLVNRGLYEMTQRKWNIDQFANHTATEDGVFGDHLRRMIVLLAQDRPLSDALRNFLGGSAALTTEQFYRLRSAGVLAGESAADCRPRCGLYETYLKRSLA